MEDNEMERMEALGSKVVEGKQYVVVKIGSEQFGIDIGIVDNIVRMQRITRVPKAQPYYKGVINLRGDVVPVMSIRTKFGMDPDVYSNTTRIIIAKLEGNAYVGFIVDEVRQIVTLSENDIEKPTFRTSSETDSYLSGVGKCEDMLISLLDMNAVVDEGENS